MLNLNFLKKQNQKASRENSPPLETPQERPSIDVKPVPPEVFSVEFERRLIRLEMQVGELMTLLLKEDKYSKTHEKSLSKVGKVLKRQFNLDR